LSEHTSYYDLIRNRIGSGKTMQERYEIIEGVANYPIGSEKALEADFRLISMTNLDLLVASDLYLQTCILTHVRLSLARQSA
jgi:sigma54-dependent transcription regulator